MKTLTSIVALNPRGAIGAGNRLPWRVRSDLRFFRDRTVGQVVIMGRRTYDSLDQRGLPDRKNIVVTHGFGLSSLPSNCRPAGSIAEALLCAEDWKTQRQLVFVVGGASMYEQFAPFVDRYLLTIIEKAVPEADTFFSEDLIGDENNWKISSVLKGKADGLNDEADFEVFEFIKSSPEAEAHRRELAIDVVRRRRSGNALVDDRWIARVAG